MTIPQRNSLLVLAILAGLLSLPMTWFTTTLNSFSIQIGPGHRSIQRPLFSPPLVTGFTGVVSIARDTPLWFIVAISITASVMQFMILSSVFAIPRWALILTPSLGICGAILPLFSAYEHEQISVGPGWVLGMFCACAPLVCLLLWTRTPRPELSGEASH